MQKNRIDPHDVEQVLVKTTTRGADILSDPSKYQPTTKETADHSLPYGIAVAVAKGHVLPSDFSEAALKDPLVWELLPRIKVVADPQIDLLFPKVKRAIVTITTKSGETYTQEEDFAKGQPERPLSGEELVAKFRSNSSAVMTKRRQDRAIEKTMALEEVKRVGDYLRLLIRDR